MTRLETIHREGRTSSYLRDAGDLVEFILEQIPAGSGSRVDGMPRSGRQSQGIPLRVLGGTDDASTPLEDANDLYGQLVGYATSWARTLQVKPAASTLAWYRKDEDCRGFPAWATAWDARILVDDVAGWLLGKGFSIRNFRVNDLAAALVKTYHDDMAAMFRPLYGRYSLAPRTRTTASRDCPVCERRTLIVNFDEGELPMVGCAFCGHSIPEAVVERFVEVE